MNAATVILESAVTLYLVKEVVQYLKHRRKERKDKKPFQKALLDITKLYEELNGLIVSVDADRVILLRSHNGGGKPKLGSPLFSTAEYEVFANGVKSLKPDWQAQPLDQHYISTLKDLEESGEIDLVLYGMDESSMLKKLYFANSIKCSKLIKIHESKDSFYYISLNYRRKVDFLDENFDEKARPFLTRIKQLFQNEN